MRKNKLIARSMAFSLLLLTGSAAWAQAHEHAAEGAPRKMKAAGEKMWTRLPLLLPAKGSERASIEVRALNLDAKSLDVYAPAGDVSGWRQQLAMSHASAVVQPPVRDKGNYHWLSAREETPDSVRVATSTHYFSNPGPSPAELLLARKSELEIVPNPLPREHAAYRESEKWDFLVRFNGQALASREVVMETESGSRIRFVTNSVGIARVLFPRDIQAAGEASGGHRPRPANFVLSVEHEAGAKKYLTAFNYVYRKEPERDSSLNAGLGFLVLGMLGAVPLLRRRRAPGGDENA